MASPICSPTSPRTCFLLHESQPQAISSTRDCVLFHGTITSRRLSASPSSSASLRLRERRGRLLPGLSVAMATANYTSSSLEEMSTTRSTLYEVLGVAKDATEKEVRSAYRRLALRFHPDTVSEAEQKEANTKAFLKIHSAYLTLSDQGTRSLYDRQISLQSSMKGYTPVEGGHYATQRSSSSSVTRTYSYSYSSADLSFSNYRGRNWETDQCWC